MQAYFSPRPKIVAYKSLDSPADCVVKLAQPNENISHLVISISRHNQICVILKINYPVFNPG
jgi:hypothetical protein